MQKEIKEFEAKYMETEKEVLVLTEKGSSAGRSGQDKMWHANVTILAMIDVATNELIEEKKRLTWLMTDKEQKTKKQIFDIKGKKIYRLKVRENLAYTWEICGNKREVAEGTYMWVQKVLERDCKEDRLITVLKEYEKEVVLQAKNCNELLLDKSLGMFEGPGTWNGFECDVNLDVDDEGLETAEDALKTWEKLSEESNEWDKKAREYAAKYLVDNANDWLYDSLEEDEEFEEITKEDFATRMELSAVCVSTEGNFQIYYDDDDMFWGHVIIVSGNIESGFEEADIAG